MSEGSIVLPALRTIEVNLLWFVLGSALIALLYGGYLCWKILREPQGSQAMIDVAVAIQEGSAAYLARQFKIMGIFIVLIAVGLYFMYLPIYPNNIFLPIGLAVAFLLGSLASAGAGYVGMSLAVRANVRVANAALTSFKKALELAFQAAGRLLYGLGRDGSCADENVDLRFDQFPCRLKRGRVLTAAGADLKNDIASRNVP